MLPAAWLEFSILDFTLKIVYFGDGGAESTENECEEEGGTGKHEVSLRHVEFSVVSI